MKSSWLKILSLGFLLSVSANAEPVSSLGFNMLYYKGSDGTSTSKIANPGMGIQFLTGEAGKWMRSAFGASIEMGSGTPSAGAASMMGGSLLFGGEIAPKNSQRLMPFIGLLAAAGWANYTVTDTSNNNGLCYGGVLSGGAEIKLKSGGASNLALRIQTQYRILVGSIGGGLSGSDLSAVTFGGGLVF